MFNLSQMISEGARENPNALALICEEEALTYSDLDAAVDEVALGLLSQGLRPGESVGLQLRNSPQFVATYYGALRAGLVIVPFNPLSVEREIAHILSTAQCSAVVTDSETAGEVVKAAAEAPLRLLVTTGDSFLEDSAAPVLRFETLRQEGAERREEAAELLPTTNGEDVGVLIFTSGTTGRPKAAQLTHFNLWMSCTALSNRGNPHNGGVVLACLPLFHVYGMASTLNAALAWGMTLVMLPRFTARGALQLISEHGVTRFSAVPTMISDMLRELEQSDSGAEFQLGSVQRVTVGGSTLPQKLIDAFEARFTSAELLEGYGSSETTSSVCLTPSAAERRLGSVGVPAWGTRMRIVDIDGAPMPPGTHNLGELQIKGPTIFAGYKDDPEATAEAFDGHWLKSGDIAAIDEAGFIYIKDRMKNLIIRGGYNVYAAEVESALQEHPSIEEAVVMGVPDDRVGQEIMAVLTLKPDQTVSEAEIIEFLAPRLARYKQPRRLTFAGQLPRTAAGKIRRAELVHEFYAPEADQA